TAGLPSPVSRRTAGVVADQLASETIAYTQAHRRPASSAARMISGRTVAFLLLVALLVILTVVPLATVVVGSFRPMGMPLSAGWTLQHYTQVWGDAYTYVLVRNTLVFALGA